ncbi:hypothetical protein MUBE_13170 [Mycobacterium uberis]|uniref:Uncharacterized protein n=1 Tax=Mycobacterium uberis TaxID=2162698 RepID=A0A3E1HDZ2_9MYCO|nr:hypothetical protein MUBE_13170 [Mycobacterium uberis]
MAPRSPLAHAGSIALGLAGMNPVSGTTAIAHVTSWFQHCDELTPANVIVNPRAGRCTMRLTSTTAITEVTP